MITGLLGNSKFMMDEKKSVYMNVIEDTLIHPASHLSSSVELKFGMGF